LGPINHPALAVPVLLFCLCQDHNVGYNTGERAENSSALSGYPLLIRKRVWAQRGKRYQQLGAQPASRTIIGKRMGSTTRKDVCYVAFFAFFGVFAFFVFARCGAVGAAALVLVSPGATAPPGAGAVTWPGVPARAGPPEL